ncbi:hypothetical protein OG495_15350 [Streptomyces longwoodensis]|uniref:hypothetical protein n=1 Tax=Streptomyces longwoodensis TaxID=68231 RepID=UPI00386380F8
MSATPRPSLKSIPATPDGPRPAGPAAPLAAVGEPKGAARKGVPTSPDPHPTDPSNPTPDRPGIRICAPPVYRHHYDSARWSPRRYGDTPTAAYACPCGQTRTARGQDAVAALVADYDTHRATCSARTTEEGRAAA